MALLESVASSLRARGYAVSVFATAAEAADYLDRLIDGTGVSFGGSLTLDEMHLYDRLSTHNTVYHHWHCPAGKTPAQMQKEGMTAEVFLTSANALTEDGLIVNVDGTGNRLAGTLCGHERVYFVVGRNKIVPTEADAIARIRSTAGPLNAARLGRNTPCVADGRCHDCRSEDRICRALLVLWEAVRSCRSEVVLIDEDLGI